MIMLSVAAAAASTTSRQSAASVLLCLCWTLIANVCTCQSAVHTATLCAIARHSLLLIMIRTDDNARLRGWSETSARLSCKNGRQWLLPRVNVNWTCRCPVCAYSVMVGWTRQLRDAEISCHHGLQLLPWTTASLGMSTMMICRISK
jgi:hypothetical protein